MEAIVEKDIYVRLEGDLSIRFIGRKTKGVFKIKDLQTIIRTDFHLEPSAYIIRYVRSKRKNVEICTQMDLDFALEDTASVFLDLRLCGLSVKVFVAKKIADIVAAVPSLPSNSANVSTPLTVPESVDSPEFLKIYYALQGRALSDVPSSSQETGVQKYEVSSTSST